MTKTSDDSKKTSADHDTRDERRADARVPDFREVLRECLAEWLGRRGMAERLF